MSDYDYNIIRADEPGQLPPSAREQLLSRPFVGQYATLAERAPYFKPGKSLEEAINTAIAVGQPLLITGEPGCGKTQSAYYVADKLGVELFRFDVKSESSARDLLYDYDQIGYFRDAHEEHQLRKWESEGKSPSESPKKKVRREDYIQPRALWEAFKYASEKGHPAVVLIDEIDKAPRDFPNDLLRELDEMEFIPPETNVKVSCPKELRPLVFITSNSERNLPEPFLRRCVYHHILFDTEILKKAVGLDGEGGEHYLDFSEEFLSTAIQCLLELRSRATTKQPSTGEFLTWLQALSVAIGDNPSELNPDKVNELPALGVLLKDPPTNDW